MYPVRDTKGTKDFLKRLRQRDRQDPLRLCNFEVSGADFAVVLKAEEV